MSKYSVAHLPFLPLDGMRCCRSATGPGFVCFVVINPCVFPQCLVNRAFLSISCPCLPPPQREIAILKKVDHPHIVRLHEVIEDPEIMDDGKLYLVMEYVTGGAVLDNTVETTPIDIGLVKQYCRGMASGFMYLHSLGIIHRDIKVTWGCYFGSVQFSSVRSSFHPFPVFLQYLGNIIDFGFSRLMHLSCAVGVTGLCLFFCCFQPSF